MHRRMRRGGRRQRGWRMIGGQAKMRRGNEEIVDRPGERGVGRARSAGGEEMLGLGEVAIGMLVGEAANEGNGEKETASTGSR